MIDKIPSDFMDFFEEKGVYITDVLEAAKILHDKGINNWKDLVWHLLQDLNFRIATNATNEQDFYKEQHDLYLHMLYLRRRYEDRKANDIMHLLNQTKAHMSNCSSLKLKVGVHGEDKRCEYSFTFKDKWFSMEDALGEGLIDFDKCTNPIGCTCAYTFKGMRDKNGNLITKEER